MSVPAEIFRAYDIRGVYGQTLTDETMAQIGRALGTRVRSAGETTVVLGRDGRLSGPALMQALKQGLIETGVHVIDIGLVPTPVLYFAIQALQLQSGFMLTGSHNPVQHNGLKMVLHGTTLYGEEIQQLRRIVEASSFLKTNAFGTIRLESLLPDYIQAVTTRLLPSPLQRLKIVIDCGNGAAGVVARDLFERLGMEVVGLYEAVDGHFPNHHPDPGQPKNLVDLERTVLKEGAVVGLAFDGDGDRLGVVDAKGQMIYPDRLALLFAEEVLQQKPGATILYDVKCTQLLYPWIKNRGGHPVISPTGHSIIKATMKTLRAEFAAEMSGHFFFQQGWFGFDDGLYAGARLLKILAAATNPAEVLSHLPNTVSTPEINLSVSEADKFSIVERLKAAAAFEGARISTLDGLRADFEDGFGLVRPSNTTACLVLRFEGHTQQAMNRIARDFHRLLQRVEPALAAQLPVSP